jgi:prophage regulatory protein
MNIQFNPATMYLTVSQVAERLGVSTDSVWRWVRTDEFPKPYKIGPNCTRWKLSDVLEHEASFRVGMMLFAEALEGMFLLQTAPNHVEGIV